MSEYTKWRRESKDRNKWMAYCGRGQGPRGEAIRGCSATGKQSYLMWKLSRLERACLEKMPISVYIFLKAPRLDLAMTTEAGRTSHTLAVRIRNVEEKWDKFLASRYNGCTTKHLSFVYFNIVRLHLLGRRHEPFLYKGRYETNVYYEMEAQSSLSFSHIMRNTFSFSIRLREA